MRFCRERPSRSSDGTHARDRIRDLTDGRRLLLGTEAVIEEVNLFLRGWVAYFRYGRSARRFSKIREFAWIRLALFLSRKHQRSRTFGRGC
jgi:RNA-directed DNA polymerase